MLLLAAAFLALTPAPILVRQSKVEITPPEPLPLGGYTERHGKVTEPGGDPLYARCLEFEQGKVKVAIVSAEMLTIPESLYREVTARIPKGIHLFMQASHTHCAPDSQMLNERMTFAIPGIATYRRRWLKWYAEKIASSITNALGAPAARIAELQAKTRVVAANRSRREGGKPDPRFVEIAGDGKPLFDYFTAHPTVYGPEELHARGDWIGLLMADGPLVLNGAIGDVSPVADGATADEKMSAFMALLRTKGTESLDAIWRGQGKGLVWAETPIKLLPTRPHPTFAKENGIPEALAQSLVDKFAPPEGKIAAIRIGGLAVVGVPGEPTSILGRQIQEAGAKLGFKSVLVCSHVNGWIGYILDPRDYDRGGYEATLSFYGREEGEQVVAAAVQAMRNAK